MNNQNNTGEEEWTEEQWGAGTKALSVQLQLTGQGLTQVNNLWNVNTKHAFLGQTTGS